MAALERKSENTATADDSPRDAWEEGYDQGAADYTQPITAGLAEAEQRTLERALRDAERLVNQLRCRPTVVLATTAGLAQLEVDLSDSLEAVQRGG